MHFPHAGPLPFDDAPMLITKDGLIIYKFHVKC